MLRLQPAQGAARELGLVGRGGNGFFRVVEVVALAQPLQLMPVVLPAGVATAANGQRNRKLFPSCLKNYEEKRESLSLLLLQKTQAKVPASTW